MAIIFKKIISNITPKKSNLCLFEHYKHELILELIHEKPEKLYYDQELTFEMNYNKLLNFELVSNFNDDMSSIYQNTPNSTILIGRIANIITEGVTNLFDVYIMNGAEFLCIDFNELTEIQKNQIQDGVGVKVEVDGLKIYPY